MWPFKRKPPDPTRPLAEYPRSGKATIVETITEGLNLHQKHFPARKIVVSWGSQGGRLDSYYIEDAYLEEHMLTFTSCHLDPGKLSSQLHRPVSADGTIDVSDLASPEIAELVQTVFVDHLGMKPWEDTGEYCAGVELV